MTSSTIMYATGSSAALAGSTPNSPPWAEGDTEIKLEAGSLVLYPTTVLHRVAPVTEGVRLAAVGWVRSYIRRQDQRDILFDLELAAREIFETQGKTPLFDRMAGAKANLFRLWAED